MSGNFGSTRTVTARKDHRCEECGRTILAGERYDRHAGKWEGNFFTNVACGHCATLRRMVGDVDLSYHDDYFGGLGEWTASVYPECTAGDFTADLSLARAIRDFRRRWLDDDGSVMPLPDTWVVAA